MHVVRKIVLIVGEEKNRGEWRKGQMVRFIRGKGGVVRVGTLLYEGRTIEQLPANLLPGNKSSGSYYAALRNKE